MYIQLYEKLVVIQKAYENISVLGEQIYENLKQKNINEVQRLQVEQLRYIDGVKQLTTTFKDSVVQCCQENGVEPFRMHSLFSYFSEEEIKKNRRITKKTTGIRKKCKNNSVEKSILFKYIIKNYRKYCGFCF